MSLLAIKGFIPWPGDYANLTTNGLSYATTLLIDAASEKAAFIVAAPKAGNIDQIGWRTGTVTTGATVDVRVETVDGATGDPSGTLWAATTNGSQVVADTDDNVWFNTTLTAAATVAQGDKLAIVIANPAVSFGNMVVASTTNLTPGFPYSDLFTAAWAKTANCPILALRYSDGTYEVVPSAFPASNLSTQAMNTGTTPDEAGNRIVLPFMCRVVGWWAVLATNDAARDFDVVFYDTDGTTALLTDSYDSSLSATTAQRYRLRPFSSTYQPTVNGAYRIVIKPTTAASVNLTFADVQAAAIMDAYTGGQNVYWTQRTDAGAWTETTTRRAMVGVLIDQLSDGGVAPSMRVTGGGIMPVY